MRWGRGVLRPPLQHDWGRRLPDFTQGGRLIFLYDVETRNPLVSAMRRRSNSSYDSEFILRDGHLGYETHLENLETFQRHGFRIIEQLGLERSPLQSTAVYSKMRRFPQPFSTLGSFLHRIEKRRVTFYAHIGVLRLIDETIGRLMPGKWARMALTVCEKIP